MGAGQQQMSFCNEQPHTGSIQSASSTCRRRPPLCHPILYTPPHPPPKKKKKEKSEPAYYRLSSTWPGIRGAQRSGPLTLLIRNLKSLEDGILKRELRAGLSVRCELQNIIQSAGDFGIYTAGLDTEF